MNFDGKITDICYTKYISILLDTSILKDTGQ